MLNNKSFKQLKNKLFVGYPVFTFFTADVDKTNLATIRSKKLHQIGTCR